MLLHHSAAGVCHKATNFYVFIFIVSIVTYWTADVELKWCSETVKHVQKKIYKTARRGSFIAHNRHKYFFLFLHITIKYVYSTISQNHTLDGFTLLHSSRNVICWSVFRQHIFIAFFCNENSENDCTFEYL